MITPKPCGLILLISFFNLFFSSFLAIFCETDTLSENGVSTIYLPARDSSAVSLGPFVEIGSFDI